jgi:hypothetical protein
MPGSGTVYEIMPGSGTVYELLSGCRSPDHRITAIARSSSGPLLRHNHRLLRREWLARICRHGNQQGFFAIDQIAGIERGQLKAVAVRDGVRGAGFNAVTAEDAAVIVNVIDLGVAFRAADALLFRIVCGFNVNAIGRARGRAKKTGNALFQTVFIALQLMQPAETFLKNRALIGQLLVGIILNNGGSKHLPQSHGHSLRDASKIAKDTKDRHEASIIRNHKGHKGARKPGTSGLQRRESGAERLLARSQSFLSGHRKLYKTECHIEGAQHEHPWNEYRHSAGEQCVSLEGCGYVVGRCKSGHRQHQTENA